MPVTEGGRIKRFEVRDPRLIVLDEPARENCSRADRAVGLGEAAVRRDSWAVAVQPTGTVTLLFTDIEGSTRLLERLGADRYAQALERHRRLLRHAFDCHGGYEVDCEGDAFFVAFRRAGDAVAAAAEAQQALAAAEWPEGHAVRVRMGLHTGEPVAASPKYVGLDVHKAARVMAAGHGGQVLLTQATRQLVGDDVRVLDLGLHRLKDLTEPQRLYQLGEDKFTPLKTLYRSNLPVPATPFVGREREVTEITRLLRDPATRVVTLVGPGGVGKTRLALQAAAEAAEAFPDGVTWVPLALVRDPALLVDAVAGALGVRERLDGSSIESLARELTGRRLLLLDNAEHLLPGAAEQVAELRNSTDVILLVTSRERLHIGGEQAWPVPLMSERDAVELFLAAARRSDPGFPDSPTVHEICGRLDELPLAIELAAARARTFTAKQLLDRLARQLDLSGARDADPRQATLRATIDWSYALLEPEEQRLLRRLSIFVGGCTLEAAEEVCSADVDVLESLLDKSLVRRRARDDGSRFWLLETIREYAAERLSESHDAEHRMRIAHADYFLSQALAAEGTPERVDPTAFSRLAADLANLRAALQTSADLDQQRFSALAASLGEFFEYQGHLTEGDQWLRLALSRSQRSSDHDNVKIHTGLAKLALRRGDTSVAAVQADAALAMARTLDDRCLLANALRARAIPAVFVGDFDLARRFYDEAVALLEEEHADALLAAITVDLTDLSLNEHNWEEAAALAGRGISIGRDAHPVGETVSYLNLGIALLELARADEAYPALLRAVELVNDLGLALFLGGAMIRLAETLVDTDPSRAALLFGAGEQLQYELSVAADPLELRAADRTASRLRTRLAPDEFEARRAEGRRLDRHGAVRLALRR